MPDEEREMFLITEYCPSEIYTGWHLYLRDNNGRQQRNADGDWGWLCRGHYKQSRAHEFLATLGITVKGDGTCDGDGYAEVARRFPIPRQRIGGKPRHWWSAGAVYDTPEHVARAAWDAAVEAVVKSLESRERVFRSGFEARAVANDLRRAFLTEEK
jgi:hypothetical protein